MGRIDNHVLFLVIFLGLAALYGVTTGSDVATGITNSINTINAPWPAPPTVVSKCSPNDLVCEITSFGSNAVNFLGAQAAWFVAILGSQNPQSPGFFPRISAISALAQSVLFAPLVVGRTVPFGGVVIVAIILIVSMEFIRIFRGSSSGV